MLCSSPQLQATRHFSFWQDFKEKLNKEIKANKELSQNLDELSKIKDEGTRFPRLPPSLLLFDCSCEEARSVFACVCLLSCVCVSVCESICALADVHTPHTTCCLEHMHPLLGYACAEFGSNICPPFVSVENKTINKANEAYDKTQALAEELKKKSTQVSTTHVSLLCRDCLAHI